jgi:Spy/CpxP family protein refolding chaperone
MSGTLKPWLILAVIFIAGGFTGAALTMVFSGHFMHPPGPPADMREAWMGRLTRQLNLTPDQQAKIEPILRDTSDKVQKIHQEEFDKIRPILQASDDQIAAILTPEQKAQLKQMAAKRDEDFQRRQRQWGTHNGGPDGGHDGGHFHNGGGPGAGYPPPEGQGPEPANPPPPATNAPGH